MAISRRVRLVAARAVGIVALSAIGACSLAAPPAFEWNVMLGGWHVLGPIAKLDRGSGELERELVADEATLNPAQAITVEGNDLQWRRHDARMVDFIRALEAQSDAGQHALAYACTEFTSEEPCEAVLSISHDDGVVIWLNGVEIHRQDAATASKLDQAAIKVALQQGTNTLLAKVSQGTGSWEFAARLLPPDIEQPLITLSCDGSWGGDMSRLPTLQLDLLDAEGEPSATWHASGGRVENPRSIRYTVYAAEQQPAPAKVRVRYNAPGFAPFDKTHDWTELCSGNVSVPLTLAAPIRGRVIDEATGASVVGAEFRSAETILGDRSDRDGRFELAAADPLADFVLVLAAGYEPRQTRIAWPPNDDWTVKLQPGGHVLRGRVLTSDGKPLPNAVIRAYGGNRQLNLTTDAEGRFEAIGLSSERSTLYPTVSHPDHIAKDEFSLPLNADGETEVEWRLEPGAIVTGRVMANDDGRPLEGITITSGADRFTSNRVNPRTTTDADGRYRLGGIVPGPALVHAFSERFAPAMHEVTTSRTSPTTSDFILEKGRPITGRVIDPEGNPVVGVTLATDKWNGARMLDRRVTTDSNGEFRYENMPATPVEIHMFKQGWVSKRDFVATGGEQHEITLMPIVEHKIHLRLADTGEAPSEIAAQVGYLWPGRSDIAWQDNHHFQGTKYDPAAGVFRLRIDEPSNAKLSWRLRVPGYRDVIIDNPKPGSEALTQEVLFERVPAIRGRVVDADTAAPVEGVMVAIVDKQDRMRLDRYTNFDNRFPAVDEFTGVHTTTATDGSFELPKPTDDQAEVDLLLFRKGGGFHYLQNARALLAGENISLPFPQGGAVEGRVIVAGKPVAESQVHLAWIAPGADAHQWDLPFGFGGQVTTDAEGRYHYSGLGPGRYRVGRVRSFKNPLGGGSISMFLTGEELVVHPGETVVHEFDQPGGYHISGRAVGKNEEPLPNCIVSVAKSNGPSERIDAVMGDAEGRFKIEHLQPGTYQLTADQYEMTTDGCGLGSESAHGTTTVHVLRDTDATIKLLPRTQAQVARTGSADEPTLVGSVPPDFTGKLFGSDETFTLSDHFGKVVAIDFWATWCGPCMAVMPEMKALHEKYKDADDVVFVTVSLDSDPEALRSVIDEQGLEFPVIYESRDTSQVIAHAFGVRGIPSSFVIGRNGRFASDRVHGSQLLATTDAAVNVPLDPAFAKAGKPARLTVKLSLDGDDNTGPPGATITLAANNADGTQVLEETIRTPGLSNQFTWLYPPLENGGELRVRIEAEGMPAQEKTIAAPEANAEVAFAFASPREITGTVWADNGTTPVPGVKITAYRPDVFRRTAVSDAEGKFRITVLPGSYTVTFTGTEDFAPVTGENRQVEVSPESDPESIGLTACRTVAVHGTVTDPEGAPVAGAEVRPLENAMKTTTDDQGRFELRGIPSQGTVRLYAIKQPLYAMVTLQDFDGVEPQALVLSEQAGQQRGLAPGAKAPPLMLATLDEGEPVEWQAAGDKETLLVFCALWHPAAHALLEPARKWAEEHQARFVVVSTDWSLGQARREAERLAQQQQGPYEILFAGPGGLSIAKDWNLKSPAQACWISADGKIKRSLPPGQLP